MQAAKPAAWPAYADAPLGMDVVVRWHREWNAQTLDVMPQPHKAPLVLRKDSPNATEKRNYHR